MTTATAEWPVTCCCSILSRSSSALRLRSVCSSQATFGCLAAELGGNSWDRARTRKAGRIKSSARFDEPESIQENPEASWNRSGTAHHLNLAGGSSGQPAALPEARPSPWHGAGLLRLPQVGEPFFSHRIVYCIWKRFLGTFAWQYSRRTWRESGYIQQFDCGPVANPRHPSSTPRTTHTDLETLRYHGSRLLWLEDKLKNTGANMLLEGLSSAIRRSSS